MIRNLLLYTLSLITVCQLSAGLKEAEIFDWSRVVTQSEQAKYISSVLDAWNIKFPMRAKKPLRVVYFYAKDRKPVANYLERWDGIISDIQDFFKTEMNRLGYQATTFTIEKETGKLNLHKIRGSDNDKDYNYKSGAVSYTHLRAHETS